MTHQHRRAWGRFAVLLGLLAAIGLATVAGSLPANAARKPPPPTSAPAPAPTQLQASHWHAGVFRMAWTCPVLTAPRYCFTWPVAVVGAGGSATLTTAEGQPVGERVVVFSLTQSG